MNKDTILDALFALFDACILVGAVIGLSFLAGYLLQTFR